jgi:CTP:molybdopterin cytidylyltransferase MocA
MPHLSDNPRYIVTSGSWLVVSIRVVAHGSSRDRLVTKSFKVARGQSSDAAMALAIRWRDRAWRRIFGGDMPARSFHDTARVKSATGVPGVRFVTKSVRSASNPHTIPYVMAEVHSIPGKDYRRSKGSRSRLFALLTYEVDEAIALATAWRAAALAELLRPPE